MTGQNNDLQKGALLNIQKKLSVLLNFKGGIQMPKREKIFSYWIHKKGLLIS